VSLAHGAGAVTAHAFAHGRALAALPYYVVARVVVDGNVVVHGVVGNVLRASYAGKDSRVEHLQERRGGWWWGNLSAEDLAGSPSAAVQLLVGISPLDDTTALQTDTGEQSLCLAVAENTSHALQTRRAGSLGIATDGPRRDGDIAAQCQRAGLRKCTDGGCVVEDEDEVGELKANLSAEAAADGSDGRGCRPRSVCETSDDDARSESRCAEEAGLEDCENREALGCVSISSCVVVCCGVCLGSFVTPDAHRVLTFALARTLGGIILSGPKACLGSTKDARIFPVLRHSPESTAVSDVTGPRAAHKQSGRHVT